MERKSKYEGVDITGQRFGKLTAIERAEDRVTETKTGTKREIFWKCRCDCGKEVEIRIYDLMRANGTKACLSCGRSSKNKYIPEENNGKVVLHDNREKNFYVPIRLNHLVLSKQPIEPLDACQLVLDEGSSISMCFFNKDTDERANLCGSWSKKAPYFSTVTNKSIETYNKYVRNKLTKDNLTDWLDKSINQFDNSPIESEKTKFWDIIPAEVRELHGIKQTGITTDVSIPITVNDRKKRIVVTYQNGYMNVEEMIIKLEAYTKFLDDVYKVIWVLNGLDKKNNLLNLLAEMRRHNNLYVFVDNYDKDEETRAKFDKDEKLIYLDNAVFRDKTYLQLREEIDTLIQTKCSRISKEFFLNGIYNGVIPMDDVLLNARGNVETLYNLVKNRETELGKFKYFTVTLDYIVEGDELNRAKTFVLTEEEILFNKTCRLNKQTKGHLVHIYNPNIKDNPDTDYFVFKNDAVFGFSEDGVINGGISGNTRHFGWTIDTIYTTKGTYRINNKSVKVPSDWLIELDKQYKEWAKNDTEKVETPKTETKPIEKTKPLIKLAPVEKKSETEVKPARAMTYEKYMEKKNAEPVKEKTDNIQTFSFFNDELLPPNNITIKQIEGQGIIEIKFGIIPDADYYGFFMSDDKTFPDNRTLKMGKIKDTIFRVDNLRPKTYYIKGLSYNIAYGKTNKSDWSEVVEFTLK